MFQSGHWAAALINSLEKEGGEIEDGIEFLKVLAGWVKNLPGEVSGSYAAEKMESLVREASAVAVAKATAVAAAKATANSGNGSPQETVIRFFVLLVKKNNTRHLDSVIAEAEKLLNKKRGIIEVSVEYASAADENMESFIKEEIKKRTGAAGVNLTGRINAGLIGGYRLRMGDEIIDASVRCQLRKLETCLGGY